MQYYAIHVLWKYYHITSQYRKVHVPQKTNLRPSGVSYDLPSELDFPFPTLSTGNFFHSDLKKEPLSFTPQLTI